MTAELEREIGRIGGKIDEMAADLKEFAKLIPTVAVHEERLNAQENDLNDNIKPMVQDHEKKMNGAKNFLAFIAFLFTAAWEAVKVGLDYFMNGGNTHGGGG